MCKNVHHSNMFSAHFVYIRYRTLPRIRHLLIWFLSTITLYNSLPPIPQGKLLGVVGIDVPLELLHQDIPQHKLGVHGYVFIINHNGYVMHHPELRSFIQGESWVRTKRNLFNHIIAVA